MNQTQAKMVKTDPQPAAENMAGWSNEDPYNPKHYQADLPDDTGKDRIGRGLKLVETYAGIPADEVRAHVKTVRDEAYAVYQYPCLGRWSYLEVDITEHPSYATILSRLKSGAKLLDVGCCLGQGLRQLAADGAPTENLAGLDYQQGFIDLGYALFRDRGRFKGRFVVGDVLSSSPAALGELDGAFDVLHLASVLHLFAWDDQVRVGERIVRFLKPGAADVLIVGRQRGSREPVMEEGGGRVMVGRFGHNIETFQALWDVVGERTGTRWKVSGEMIDDSFGQVPMIRGGSVVMRFEVRRAT